MAELDHSDIYGRGAKWKMACRDGETEEEERMVASNRRTASILVSPAGRR